jgi:hypothetical protein
MKRIFKTKSFSRDMRKIVGLTDSDLCASVEEMAQGLIDADLGRHVVKKRVAVQGHGKRDGARTLVATSVSNRWFFLFIFKKNESSNVSKKELTALQEIADDLLSLDDAQLISSLETQIITEICHEDKKQNS